MQAIILSSSLTSLELSIFELSISPSMLHVVAYQLPK